MGMDKAIATALGLQTTNSQAQVFSRGKPSYRGGSNSPRPAGINWRKIAKRRMREMKKNAGS